ncbi:hypothetical protein [Burkholderia multivorans]|uniref:hypothetical protein n=1 Tax=Burkholderia multivorans TaxID=87883 RepID=UPI0021BE4C32|nr:hypothetical protein [Burkholderia multivorans]
MNEIKDGGPAFPGKASINRSSGELQPHQFGNDDFETLGMTLRDYFAAKAMRPLTLSMKVAREEEMHHMAREAYAVADAMLRARGEA